MSEGVTFKPIAALDPLAIWYVAEMDGVFASRVGFVLPYQDEPPSEITLLETWENAVYAAGCYVFLPTIETSQLLGDDFQIFISAVAHYLNQPARAAVRFLWVDSATTLATGIDQWFFFSMMTDADGAVMTDRLTSIPFDFFDVIIGKGTAVTLRDDHSGFDFAVPTHPFYPQSHAPNTEPVERISAALLIEGKRRYSVRQTIGLDLAGANAGQLNVRFDIEHIGLFHVGLRLYYQQSPTEIGMLHYPIFNDEGITEGVARFADVSMAFNPDNHRSPILKLTTGLHKVRSFYRTIHGHWLTLTPQDDTYLLPVDVPPLSGDDRPTTYYVPQGHFEIGVQRRDRNGQFLDNTTIQRGDRILCGLSGMEYINLVAADEDPNVVNTLYFEAGQPAFAAYFKIPERDDAEIPPVPEGEQRLDPERAHFVTSWVRVEQTDKSIPDQATDTVHPTYYAQPDLAPFYAKYTVGDEAARLSQAGTISQVLVHAEVPAADIVDTDFNAILPMMPYGGIERNALQSYQQMEQQVINPTRRNNLALASLPLSSDESPASLPETITPVHRTTTPYGLMIDFSTTYAAIAALTLAQYTADSAPAKMQFTNIDAAHPLRSALQSNQLFMVMTQGHKLASFFPPEQARVIIDQWPFDLNPTRWLSQSDPPAVDTLLIFKYFDKPLAELVRDASLWTLPDEYNISVVDAQRKLLRYMREIETRKDDPAYAYLHNIFYSKRWSGIIALNLRIDQSDFPDDLKGLLADPTFAQKVFAAYLVIETTPIKDRGFAADGTDLGLDTEQSALYALIDYKADRQITSEEDDYDFYVARLRARFENSVQTEFAAEIVVTLNTLFKERTQLLDTVEGQLVAARRNDLALKGRYEAVEGGKGRYSFSFAGNNRFLIPTASALTEITIVKADFATTIITEENGAELTAPKISSRFAFWGRLNFGTFDELFDILSFGGDQNVPTLPIAATDFPPADTFLSFANMGLQMVFYLPDSSLERQAEASQALADAEAALAPRERELTAIRRDIQGLAHRQTRAQAHLVEASTAIAFLSSQLALYDGILAFLKRTDAHRQLSQKRDAALQVQQTAATTLATLQSELSDLQERNTRLSTTVDGLREARNTARDTLDTIRRQREEAAQRDTRPQYTIDETTLGFNIKDSKARAGSIFAKFPMRFQGIISSDQHRSFDALGYMPMTTPLGGNAPSNDDWYAMVYQMDLGTLGALSGGQILRANIIVTWSRESESIFVGMKLPGSSGGKREIVLQGILKVTFEQIVFAVTNAATLPTDAPLPAYSIRLRNVQLKILVLSLPTEGKAEIMIFGDPNAERGESLLGWYAAYAKPRKALASGSALSDGNNQGGRRS